LLVTVGRVERKLTAVDIFGDECYTCCPSSNAEEWKQHARENASVKAKKVWEL
jgi:hypothetical protein